MIDLGAFRMLLMDIGTNTLLKVLPPKEDAAGRHVEPLPASAPGCSATASQRWT